MSEQELLDQIDNPLVKVLVQRLFEQNQKLLETVEKQNVLLEKLQSQNEQLQVLIFGKKSERIPQIEQELKKKDSPTPQQKAQRKKRTRAKRKKNKTAKKAACELETVEHLLAPNELTCPSCGGSEFIDLPSGETSFEYEYVPARVKVKKHIRQKKLCACKKEFITAPAPSRVGESSHHGPHFHAHIVVSKCLDAIPLHRQAEQFRRNGIPMHRSTLTDLFHRTARIVRPVYDRLMEKIAISEQINGDETRIPVKAKGKCRTAWIWTFLSATMIGFVYSFSRSGRTPLEVLGKSQGTLQVDAYTGYNKVCVPEGRKRVGCWAHARRKFFVALKTAPQAQVMLEMILELYRVEYLAAELKILKTPKHTALRILKSQDILDEMHKWLEEERKSSPPQSPLGQAITYTLNQWETLILFIKDSKLPLDNNTSERALRPIALGRKNFLFVGNDRAGENLACLQSLVSTCVANSINPQQYLADLLIRIQNHPQNRIDELLPMNWQPT